MRRALIITTALWLSACLDLEATDNNEPEGDVPLLANPDASERAWRLAYHEQRIVQRHLHYTVGDTDASHRLLGSLAGARKPVGYQRPEPTVFGGTRALPDRWDWREHGVGLTPVRQQGDCGSCWAFGTTAALEGAIAIFGGEKVDLSEQYVNDCNNQGYSCNGGYWAYDMLVNPGDQLEADYPYTGYDGSCAASGNPYPYQIESYGSVQANNVEAMKQAIYQYGVIGVTMAVCGSIPGYTGGVYDSTECNNTQTNHIVAIVGWDDTVSHNLGSGVWIMRNSWGSSWGENGYMRMAYGTASIEEDPTYVVWIDPSDVDEDGVPDAVDNCPDDPNPDQGDADLDNLGDECDPTFDPTDNPVNLGDDDSVRVSLGFTFPFFGQSYTEVYVNSDGNLTFGSSDSDSAERSVSRFLTGAPRIGPLFADLDPASGGQIITRKEDPDSLSVRYVGVPEFSSAGGGGTNTVSVELHASGIIRLTFTGAQTASSIVGITRGGTQNTGTESDLSSSVGTLITYGGSGAVFEEFAQGESFDLAGTTLVFAENADANALPTAAIDATTLSGPAPLEVELTGQASDPDGSIVGYAWDLGDGTTSTEQSPVKVYDTPGTYTVALTVTDDLGGTGSANVTVAVSDPDNPDNPDDPDNPDPGPGPDDPTDDGGSPTLVGGCSLAGAGSGTGTAGLLPILFALGLAVRPRRRRRR